MTTRRHGSRRDGGSFDETTIEKVWQKGRYVSGTGADERRTDACGATIRKGSYGSLTTMGWEVDHIRPVAHDGGDELANLQPLQWENNRQKGDELHNRYCVRMT